MTTDPCLPRSLRIILPCFNEEKAIPEVLPEVLTAKEKIEGSLPIKIFITVVDDGSTDHSLQRLNLYAADIDILRHDTNQGYGSAIKTGIAASNEDWIAVLDLDDTCKAIDLQKMLSMIPSKPLFMITGQRIHPQSSMPKHRRAGNSLFAWLVRYLFNQPLKDVCSGFRLFSSKHKAKLLSDLPNDLGFTLGLTLMSLNQRWPMLEVDITYSERLGRSKLSSVKYGFRFFVQILRARLTGQYR